MTCREFFESNAQNADKCKSLQEQPLDVQLKWQTETASQYSPSPVGDEEELIRYWLNPVHYDQNSGTLKPTAFQDMSDKGLSINRAKFATLEEVEQLASQRVNSRNLESTEQRQLIGYSIFLANEARSIVAQNTNPQGRPVLGVYDTAKEDDPSHGDVCQLVDSKHGGRSARTQMRDLANSRMKRFAN